MAIDVYTMAYHTYHPAYEDRDLHDVRRLVGVRNYVKQNMVLRALWRKLSEPRYLTGSWMMS